MFSRRVRRASGLAERMLHMIRITKWFIPVLLVVLSRTALAEFKVLHSFGLPPLGAYGTLRPIGSVLYGTSEFGGGNGTAFKINADGTGYEDIHLFGTNNDSTPSPSGLTPAGSILYGMTGAILVNAPIGTIFQMNTDGTGYSLLHTFAGQPNEGSSPIGGVTLVDSTLYGTTARGGSFNNGTVYKIGIDGTDLTLLHSFPNNFLGYPNIGPLVSDGAYLYGTTYSFPGGSVFKIGLDGSGFETLHAFSVPSGAFGSYAEVILNGSTLYGTTDSGAVYKINTDGTGYQILHSLLASEGAGGVNGLILSNDVLYGTCLNGGDYNLGTVFKLNTDGTGFSILHSFAGGLNGTNPNTTLALIGNTLYGTTGSGGMNRSGIIFALTVPEPSSLALGILATLVMPFLLPTLRRASKNR